MKFRARINVGYDVIIEAEDMYEADEILQGYAQSDLIAKIQGERPTFVDRNPHNEFPEPA